MRFLQMIRLCALVPMLMVAGANAGEFGENPAFCYGFLAAQSPQQEDELLARLAHIEELHARSGPVDSTDGRSFEDWESAGRDAASKYEDPNYVALLEACDRLLAERTG